MDLPSSTSFIDHLITELASINPSPNPPQHSETTTTPQNPFTNLPPKQLAKVKPIILTLHCLFPNDLLPALDILDRRLVQRLVRAEHDQDQDHGQLNTTASVPDEDHATVADGITTQTTEDPRIDQTRPEPGPSPRPQESITTSTSTSSASSIFLVTSASAIPAPRQTGGYSTSTSASAPTPTPATQDAEKGYEVRLKAWNCTCPTFALSAFKDLESRQGASANQDSLSIPERQIPNMAVHDGDSFASASASASASVVYPFGGTLNRDTDRGSPPVCKHILACVLFARCSGSGSGLFGLNGGGRFVSLEEMAGWCAGWGG